MSKPIAHKELIVNKKLYVVIAEPGTQNEHEVIEYYGSKEAYRFCQEMEEEFKGTTYDVMKRLPDGSLTTEF